MVFFPCAFSLALFLDSRRVLGWLSILLWTQIIVDTFLVLARGAASLATTAGEGEGRESTALLGALLRGLLHGLRGDFEDCLERFALVGLHGLLDVRDPRVALSGSLLGRSGGNFHFVLGTRQLFNEPRGVMNKEIPLTSVRKRVVGIRSDCR